MIKQSTTVRSNKGKYFHSVEENLFQQEILFCHFIDDQWAMICRRSERLNIYWQKEKKIVH